MKSIRIECIDFMPFLEKILEKMRYFREYLSLYILRVYGYYTAKIAVLFIIFYVILYKKGIKSIYIKSCQLFCATL